MSDARTSVVRASLMARTSVLREAESTCRDSYKEPHMKEMSDFLADTYEEAARVLERRRVEWENERAKPPAPAEGASA